MCRGFVLVLAVVFSAPAAMAQSAADILKKVDQAGLARTTRIELTQTVITPSGDKRTFTMVSFTSDNGAKGLTEYLSPNQVRGMKILTLNDGDDIWVYFPRTNRTRKIASSARNRRVQGSDFTYDDLASGKLAKHWQGTVTGSEKIDGKDCFVLAVKPTPSGPRTYSRATVWVNKADYTVPCIEYFDLDGDKIKRLDIKDYRLISKIQIPFSYTMTNLTDGGKTTMIASKAEVNVALKPGLFAESQLAR